MPKITALLLAVVMFSSACGDDSSTAALADDPNRPKSFEDLDRSSPLNELLGFGFTDNEAMEQEFADMQRRAEDVIAECMRAEGFEYTPRAIDSAVFAGGPFAGGDGLAYYSEEWVAKYGFGISTTRWPQSAVGPNLIGYDDLALPDITDMPTDPNSEYLSSLAGGEREAWQEAMNGEPPDFSGEDFDPDEPQFFEPGGCQGEAFSQVYSDAPGGSGQRFFEAFGDELMALSQRAEADPRVVEYRSEVSVCVSDAGFLWTGEERPWEYFEPKLNEIGNQGFSGDPFAGTDVNPEEMSEREMDEFFASLNQLDDEDRAKLAALQAEEIELAQIVVGCGGGELNEQYFLSAIREEYETDFIAANADALEEFRNDG